MKKIIATVIIMIVLLNPISAFAATNVDTNMQDMSITITSPISIESKPVCEENIDFTITNNTNHELTDIACYLMILDKGRGQTYPVDEFGQEAYQTRSIKSIPAGGAVSMSIPVKVTYVGDFKFNINAINYGNDTVYTSNTLSVHMIQNSSMNKSLVMAVAAVVPIIALGLIVFMTKGKKKQ